MPRKAAVTEVRSVNVTDATIVIHRQHPSFM